MSFVNKFHIIEQYYYRNRAVGHTEAMLRGVQNMDKVAVLLPTLHMGDVLVKHRNPKAKLISWSSHLDEALCGLNLPLVLDHTMTELLCREASSEIELLKAKIHELTSQRSTLKTFERR